MPLRNTKKLSLFLALGLLLLTLALGTIPAFAEDPSSNSARVETPTMSDDSQLNNRTAAFKAKMDAQRTKYEKAKGIIGEHRDTFMDRIASGTDAVRELVKERRAQFAGATKARVKNLLDAVTRRMQSAIDRFDQIADRIESRAEKIKNNGGDTTVTERFIADARTALTDAKAQLANITENDVDQIINAESPRDRFKALREKVTAIYDSLKKVHQALRNAIAALKISASHMDGRGTAEATTENNTSTAPRE